MKSLIILGIIIFIYYKLLKWYPEKFTNKYHIYFSIFIIGYIILYYLMNYQRNFIYKIFRNIKEMDERPLHDFIPYENNSMNILKYKLGMNQGWKCLQCGNYLKSNDNNNHVTYIQPLEYAGKHDINNMGLKCNRC